MPRLLQYAPPDRDYSHWFSPWPHDAEPTRHQRIGLMWSEWPFSFAEGMGCVACAWAHWYGDGYFDPCYRAEELTRQQRMTTVNGDCTYRVAYGNWVRGVIAFNPPEGEWLVRDVAEQRRQLRRLRMAQRRAEPTARMEDDDYIEDDAGCLACRSYASEEDEWDPCAAFTPTRVNDDCGYAPWYDGTYNAEARQRREERAARRRNPDYPQEYRSRRGRGSCTLRRIESTTCPRGCPCTPSAHRMLERRLLEQQTREQLDQTEPAATLRTQASLWNQLINQQLEAQVIFDHDVVSTSTTTDPHAWIPTLQWEGEPIDEDD